MIDHDILVIRGLSYGADDTGFGYGKEKKRRALIPSVGKRKFLIKGFWFLQERCPP
jgi:hypothetical protein